MSTALVQRTTTRSAYKSVLGTVHTAASATADAIESAAQGIDMLSAYLREATRDQRVAIEVRKDLSPVEITRRELWSHTERMSELNNEIYTSLSKSEAEAFEQEYQSLLSRIKTLEL